MGSCYVRKYVFWWIMTESLVHRLEDPQAAQAQAVSDDHHA